MDKNEFTPEEAAFKLVADKMFTEYLEMCSYFGSLEPEEFFDNHIRRNFTHTNLRMERSVWKYFLWDLLVYRKSQKKDNL